jgi:hypothetical protein
VVDGRLDDTHIISVTPHILTAFPSLHPDTGHLWDHLAVSVVAHTTTGTVSDLLRAVHGTRHARAVQNALTTHLTVEDPSLEDLLPPYHQAFGQRWTDAPHQRIASDDQLSGDPIENLKGSWMVFDPLTARQPSGF